jgi:hypothetical protein
MRQNDVAIKPTDPRLPEIIERVKGGSSLLEESRKLGSTHNGQLRAALRGLIGVDGFKDLMRGRIKPKKKRCNPVSASSSAGSACHS